MSITPLPDADFTPSMSGYSGQQPFRFWCQHVLPLVYDDSLSYYELLNKVVNYLNHTIEDVASVEENVSALLDSYNQLQDYVNQYFDGLDIQEEINNKLDEMARTGALNTIIDPVIAASTTAWLNANVDPVGSAVVVDSSLGITGAAADAKVTGDYIDRIGLRGANYENLLQYVDINGRVNVATSEWSDRPSGETSGMFTNHHYNSAFDVQTFVGYNTGVMYTRVIQRSNDSTTGARRPIRRDWLPVYPKSTIDAEIAALSISIDTIESDIDTLEGAVDTIGITGTDYENLLQYVDINGRVNATSSWLDKPSGESSGMFTNHHYNSAFDVQTFIGYSSGVMYTRVIQRSNDSTTGARRPIRRDWLPVYPKATIDAEIDALEVAVDSIGLVAGDYENLLQYVDINGRVNVTIYSDTSRNWTDVPSGETTGMFTNHHYTTAFDVQTFVAYNSGVMYTRVIQRSNDSTTGARRPIRRDWLPVYPKATIDAELWPQYKVLAVGDSICYGHRNADKGYVGELGVPYINMGVGGATVSTVVSEYSDSIHKFPEANNIPNQLIAYYNRSAADILSAFDTEKFTPDLILADGGINDYVDNASLGTMSSVPVASDSEAAALDRSTLIGGLEYLFYQMVKLYPKAQRFFVITHKTYRPTSGNYYPTRQNSAGYTQKGVHDAIVACCELYGVRVVDVYDEGIMDTKFSQYRTTASSWRDAGAEDYCDADGLHPLAYGYQQVYVPLIKDVIRTATVK